MIYVGINVSKDKHDCLIINSNGELLFKVIPNIVGVDIGCGMFTVKLGKINLDYKE